MVQPVRMWRIGPVEPYAQYPVSIVITYRQLRQRALARRISSGSMTFVTIEHEGQILYDSRADVPVDMAAWRAERDKNKTRWLVDKAKHEAEMQDVGQRFPGVSIDAGFSRDPWTVE